MFTVQANQSNYLGTTDLYQEQPSLRLHGKLDPRELQVAERVDSFASSILISLGAALTMGILFSADAAILTGFTLYFLFMMAALADVDIYSVPRTIFYPSWSSYRTPSYSRPVSTWSWLPSFPSYWGKGSVRSSSPYSSPSYTPGSHAVVGERNLNTGSGHTYTPPSGYSAPGSRSGTGSSSYSGSSYRGGDSGNPPSGGRAVVGVRGFVSSS